MTNAQKPIVGIPTSQVETGGNGNFAHAIGRRYVSSLIEMCGVTPLLLPSLDDGIPVKEYLGIVDGLLLTGGRANVEPHHFGGDPFPDDEPIDPARDNAVMPLIRACIDEGVPVFGTCRGIQEINVALGGSLHYRVHELPGKRDHRMRRDENGNGIGVFDLRHSITLTKNGLFQEMVGKEELMVNSLHAQGVDKVGTGIAIEAVSEDGVIEGLQVEGSKSFAVGVQWHAEFDPVGHDLSGALYRAFGTAIHAHADHRRGS
jgi:putative glutamine amidotransferase